MDANPELPILLVEDNPDDVLITKRAWKKGLIRNQLIVVNNGEKALKYLRKEEEYEKARTPCLVLLDLKMPIVNGFEVLEKVKKDEALKKIPIIVLTSSERKDDINRAYNLGCNSYIVKPVSFEKFIQSVQDIKNFWLTVSKIPDG
jgi:CheY-like chemotaxis protein